MIVHIEYCGRWNYKPRATSLVEKLQPQDLPGFISEINEGRTGSFEVQIDGKLVFSKLKKGRFPMDQEIEKWKT